MQYEKIEWKQDLDTGIRLIDRQHREFIGLVNKLLDSSLKADDSKLIIDSFSFLKYYISEHFSVEESAMLTYDYPHYGIHKSIHDTFREEINGMETTLKTRNSPHEMSMKLNYLIVNWFMNHIKVEDNKLCRFLEARAEEKNELLSDKLETIVSAFFKRGPSFTSAQV